MILEPKRAKVQVSDVIRIYGSVMMIVELGEHFGLLDIESGVIHGPLYHTFEELERIIAVQNYSKLTGKFEVTL